MTTVQRSLEAVNVPDNTSKELTKLQKTVADTALGDSKLTQTQIAKQLDCDKSTVSKILQKQHVREYILSQVNSDLLLTAARALATQSSLLSSESDYIRHQAACDLLDRNGVGDSHVVLGQAVQVKIDLS
jgi:DNA-binding MarR family transcriptional regulator